MMVGLTTLVVSLLAGVVTSLPPNYEDLDLAVDQAVGENVDINQADPNSNTIHVSHNNPKNSDIKIVQTNPFNTTIHISLNVGTGCKVAVMLTNARNVQLHISYNGMGNSECMVDIQGAFNTTVHTSFQNPRNTPVTVVMNDAAATQLYVSQNIPQKSPMDVKMENAENCQIHLAQAVPMSSPLNWNLKGDPDKNQIEVSQNAADDNSPLNCIPECPQEEYVYDYAYADNSASSHNDNVEKPAVKQVQEKVPALSDPQMDYNVKDYIGADNTDNGADYLDKGVEYEDTEEHYKEEELQVSNLPEAPADLNCPGGDLQTCVDVCPGQFGASVYGACVVSCGRRCP